ncbi:MAG: glycosyltransferase family 25 protein [Rhodobacteraceae bacterium]|nr:glycosyltransferase family 25 protein [Paracoccaceae bacterium]
MTGQLPIFVIALARAPERWAHLSARLGTLGLTAERIEALDRRAVPAARLRDGFGGSRDFPATPGDMACTLSHIGIWGRVAALGEGAAIVLEDDAGLSAGFADYADPEIPRLMRRHAIELLKLEFWPGPQRSRRFPLGTALGPAPGGATLYRLQSGFLGSCAYVLTAAGARALLERFPVPQVPVDHLLFGRAAGLGYDLLCPGFVNPAPVLHDLQRFDSDIAGERGDTRRTLSRRLKDWSAARGEARALKAEGAVRVEMQFAGED